MRKIANDAKKPKIYDKAIVQLIQHYIDNDYKTKTPADVKKLEEMKKEAEKIRDAK